jgi:hypothetical protein
MRKTICIISAFLLAAISFHASAQTPIKVNDVPQPVLKNYYLQNSKGVKDSLWTKELVSIYKVNYIDEGQTYEAQYFENGEWIRTFTEIKQTSLPTIITNQLFNLYPDYRILKSLIELNNDGKFYTLSLVRGKDAITIYFTMSGRFVK